MKSLLLIALITLAVACSPVPAELTARESCNWYGAVYTGYNVCYKASDCRLNDAEHFLWKEASIKSSLFCMLAASQMLDQLLYGGNKDMEVQPQSPVRKEEQIEST